MKKGEPADARMKAAAVKRGIKLTSLSRPIRPSDFNEFDLILAMDNKNRGSKQHFRISNFYAYMVDAVGFKIIAAFQSFCFIVIKVILTCSSI